MKKRNKKGKTKNKQNNQSFSEDNHENEFSILNEDNNNSLIKQEDLIIQENKNNKNDDDKNETNKNDIFENALLLMDQNRKKGISFTNNYEPNFSINYLCSNFNGIPAFTPSTRLNKALQIVEDKYESFIYYYTHKKSLFPTIYNQLIGISGPISIFDNKEEIVERDFIWADLPSIIFTNQKNFVNLKLLINEYINPLMKKYKIGIEEKKFFIDKLCSNIIIQEYFSYDELFMKIMELNILYEEHKLKNIGLIIIDGLNSITPRKLEISEKVNGRGYNLKFYGYNYHGYDRSSNRKNKRISNENNLMGRRQQKTENNDDVKQNLYGNISNYKKKYEINMNGSYNEIFQQHIVDLIIKYQEKMKFNLILTVFDYSQDNYYNTTSGGKFPYKDSKNAYIVNREELKKENCYFTFKLPKVHFSKKTTFLEPINLCLNYNSNLFGLITYFNANNEEKLIFHAFNKSIDDYRPTRILDKIEYDYQ